MNSNRDPMLAPGHEGLMLFDNSPEDSMADPAMFFGNEYAQQNDFLGDMFTTSPQRSIASRTGLKEPATQPTQNTFPQPGSSPDDSSEESWSDDSTRHKRKSSSLSYRTDVEMLDGQKSVTSEDTHLQPVFSNELPAGRFPTSLDAEIMNEAMAHDFDFDSAASSPSPMKSPVESNTIGHFTDPGIGSQRVQPTKSDPVSKVKVESVSSQSPSASFHQIPDAASRALPIGTRSAASSPTYRLQIHPIPPKSRVETQIPIKLTISQLPAGVDSVHLPTHTISKPKFIVRPTPERSQNMLELHSMLVCTSAMQDPVKRERAFRRAALKTRQMEADEKEVLPREEVYEADDPNNPLNGGEVYICRGCITRERKRAARKKSKKPDEEAAWTSDEARRVVVFNTTEVRKWEEPEAETTAQERGRSAMPFPPEAKQIKMPMRIACYCRHHAEKLGFQVILTLKDHEDQLIGQTMTDPIIITDDHKAQPLGSATGPVNTGQWAGDDGTNEKTDAQSAGHLSRNAFSSNDLTTLQNVPMPKTMNPSGFSPFASVQPVQAETIRSHRSSRSRQSSPSNAGAPATKRRKANGGPKLPESLMMTKAQISPEATAARIAPVASSPSTSAAPMSAVSPFGFNFPSTGLIPGQQRRTPSFPSGPPTPDSGSNDFWAAGARAQSFDTNAHSQAMYSAPSSRMQSRAPSPQAHPPASVQVAAPRAAQGLNSAQPQAHTFPRAPIINKIVPGEGPIAGGIEVTCLGSGFFNGLEVVFGNSPATTTTYWGETTLVCLLPPSNRPGTVSVTFKHQGENFASALRTAGKQSFTYTDDEEQDLFRQAFIALSEKMNGGHSLDPADFARQTLGGRESGSSWPTYGGAAGQYRQMNGGQSGAMTESTEATVMRCLELIDQDESPYPADLQMQRSNGQTMLHLAASLGCQRLVAALLARGCDANMVDRNGFSPLHMACLRNHAQVVRRLRFAGADAHLRSYLGYTPAQLTTDPLVLQMFGSSAHSRSRSFGATSLHSRGSSLQSFALATPPRSRAASLSRYSMQEDFDDSSSDDDEDDLEPLVLAKSRSRRQSRRSSTVLPDLASQKAPPATELAQNLTPAAAMVAWRDQLAAQIQQFQQTVEGILPHLQMPTLPTIPPLTGMPNYQAPAMVRRFSSLVPQRTSRPSSPAGSTDSKDTEHRWWDIFTGSQPTPLTQPSSPPAYAEIYPENSERGLDEKASAVASAQARNSKMQEVTSSAMENTDTKKAITLRRTVSSASDSELDDPKTASLAQATQPKRLRHDRNLFIFWIPVLLVIILFTFRNKLPEGWVPHWDLFGGREQAPGSRVVEINA